MTDALLLLAKTTLTMTGISLLALAVSPLLRRRRLSRGLYALWLVVLVGWLIPASLPHAPNAVTLELPQVVSQPIALGRPFADLDNPEPRPGAVAATGAGQAGAGAAQFTLAQALVALYIVGAAASLAVRLGRHLRLMATIRRWSQPAGDAETLAALEQAKGAVGVRKGPGLAYCAAVDSVMLAGLLRPRVLLPERLPVGETLELVLRHELTHYRRGDLLVRLVEMLVCSLHWFNPAAYATIRTVDAYCELSCDALAMRHATGEQRALYSHAILDALRRRPKAASMLTTSFSTDARTLKRRVMEIMSAKNQKRVWVFALCAALLTLGLGACFALADSTGAADTGMPAEWNVEPMTVEEMEAVYRESFERMGTSSNINIQTAEDIPAFEAEYTERTGFARKDDLVICTVPGAHDIPYGEALKYAKRLIMDKYGTPESKLDAMGVYPVFYDYVYMEDESEWSFYITPRTNVNIDLDHTYDGQGEYRVEFKSPSGEVTLCNWYIDDFWSYAQRTWDAGKRDVVYEQFKRPTFYHQTLERQAHFTQLLLEAGYDVGAATDTGEALLKGMELDLLFCEPEKSVLLSDDANVKTALTAMEREYGLTRDMLEKHAFTATYSPMQTGTTDICFAYNYNIEADMYDAGELDQWTGRLFSYVSRLGTFMVCLDAQTGGVVGTVHSKRTPAAEQALDSSLLLGRRDWIAADLPEYDALLSQIRAEIDRAVEDGASIETLEAITHTLLRDAGGDPELYAARLDGDMPVTPETAAETGRKAALEASGMTREAFDDYYQNGDPRFDGSKEYTVYIYSYTADQPGGDNRVYQVRVDATTGDVLEVLFTDGVG